MKTTSLHNLALLEGKNAPLSKISCENVLVHEKLNKNKLGMQNFFKIRLCDF